MRRVFKSLVCIVTSLVILTFSIVSIPASAEITPEQEVLSYCLVTNKDYFEEGIPYLPSYFQNLNGWTNNKSKWTDFISKSVYPNRMYYTRVLYSGNQVLFYIINYDEITSVSGQVFSLKNCVIAEFVGNGFTGDSPSMSLNVEEHTNNDNHIVSSLLATNYSGWVKGYISFSASDTIVTLNGLVLADLVDKEDFDKMYDDFWEGNKTVLFVDDDVEVGYDALSSFYVTYKDDLASKLSSALQDDDTSGSHSGGGFQRVQVGDDTFNEVATDLKNNTITSNIWNNLDTTTTNSIRNTYNNLKNVVGNSLKFYKDSENNYYCAASTSSGDSNYFNYDGDSTTYYQTFIYDDGSDGDVTTTPGSGGSSSGVGSGSGAYAEANASANAEGGNAEINQGDININIGGDTTSTSTSGTGSSDFDDVNVSTLEKLLDSCSSFINWVGNVLKELPPEFTMCFTALLTVVIACRIMGR